MPDGERRPGPASGAPRARAPPRPRAARAPPVRTSPAGSIRPCRPPRSRSPSFSNSLAHARLDDLARPRAALHRAGPLLAEHADGICSSGVDRRRSRAPWWTLSSSATWRHVFRPIATSFVTLFPPTGRTAVWNGEPSVNSASVVVPAPTSATATPRSLLRLGQHRLARCERARDELVDPDAGRLDALREVLDAPSRRRDDVRLDLEADRAHPERVLHALLAVDDEPAGQDVEHVAVRRDRHRARHLRGPFTSSRSPRDCGRSRRPRRAN